MHTEIELHDGVLKTRLVGANKEQIDKDRWHALLVPAITALRSNGGGSLVLPHAAADLLPEPGRAT